MRTLLHHALSLAAWFLAYSLLNQACLKLELIHAPLPLRVLVVQSVLSFLIYLFLRPR